MACNCAQLPLKMSYGAVLATSTQGRRAARTGCIQNVIEANLSRPFCPAVIQFPKVSHSPTSNVIDSRNSWHRRLTRQRWHLQLPEAHNSRFEHRCAKMVSKPSFNATTGGWDVGYTRIFVALEDGDGSYKPASQFKPSRAHVYAPTEKLYVLAGTSIFISFACLVS